MPPQDRPWRWVSWAAVSSLPQAEKISLEQQIADNAAAVQRHGGVLAADLRVPGHTRNYIELSEAAAVPELAAYAQLRDLIARRAFDVLVFRDISRLGRTAALCMTIVGLCQRARIVIYETSNPPPDLSLRAGHSEQLVQAIHSVGAQQEIRRLQERHTMGMIGRIRRGDLPGNTPYGYKVVYSPNGQRSVVVDPPAAAVIRTIFDLYLSGMGTPQIAWRLNDLNLPSASGNRWKTVMTANVIAKAERYAGWNEVNKKSPTGRPYTIARGAWEPLIDETTFERVQVERRQRSHAAKIANTIHRWSGVCICAECGGIMCVHSGQEEVHCARHVPNNAIKHAALVLAVGAAMDELPPVWAEPDDADASTALADQRTALERAMADVDAATQRADDLHIDGALDIARYDRQVKRLAARRRALIVEMQRIDAQIDKAQVLGTHQERIKEVAATGRRWLTTDDTTAANVWLRHHLRVIVTAGAITELEWL